MSRAIPSAWNDYIRAYCPIVNTLVIVTVSGTLPRMRTFTPFQLWLETEIAKGLSLQVIADTLKMPKSQLCRVRKGANGFPKPRLIAGRLVTGLSLEELLEKPQAPQAAAPEPSPAPAPDASGAPFTFAVTPERVQIALEYGLQFGKERAAFCESQPAGDVDNAWRAWCEKRQGVKYAPGPTPKAGKPRELYDHLKPVDRPDYRPDPDALASGGDGASSFGIKLVR